MKYEIYYKSYLQQVERLLSKLLPKATTRPPVIHEAMRYGVFSGGKRFRPILTLAACEALGGDIREGLYPACAVELIHAYSLIHDDLPALDNDDLRRGRPTCHKKYGEAIAILAGDGLLTLAFQVVSRVRPPETAAKVLAELSTEAGSYGMIGGQVADLVNGQKERDLPTLDYISIHKTGKLIKASAACGAFAAGASQEAFEKVVRFGELIGLAFQSVDDLIDRDGYFQILKSSEIRDKARDLIAQAKREIRPFGKKAQKLHQLAEFLSRRMPRRTHVAVDR